MPLERPRSAPMIMVFFAGMLSNQEALPIFQQAVAYMQGALAQAVHNPRRLVSAGGIRGVDFFHLTTHGISVAAPGAYVIFYVVIGLFVVLSLAVGRRAGCHTICWMAPFMGFWGARCATPWDCRVWAWQGTPTHVWTAASVPPTAP